MKKFLAMLMVFAMVLSLCACGGTTEEKGDATYRIALVTGLNDITDQSFNQATWEALEQFNAVYPSDIKYYMPISDDNAARIAATERAIADGYDVIVFPGYTHGATIAEVSELYPHVKFIALDVAKADILSAALANKGIAYDYNPDNWNLTDYVYMDNVYCATYQEQISGYMAGYGAVKLGYTKLGYLGGMAVPSVMRFGYGFILGADAAAQELGITVDMKYAYANQFFGDADITAVMDTWYAGGTEVVFSCGASIWTSVAEAAKKAGGKIIGVDVDQAPVIDKDYGEGITVTSAMKGLAPTTYNTLVDVLVHGNWAAYAGKIEALGVISEDPAANYVQLAESTRFEEGKFTYEDYASLVSALYNGTMTVSDDLSVEPTPANVNMQWLGNIK